MNTGRRSSGEEVYGELNIREKTVWEVWKTMTILSGIALYASVAWFVLQTGWDSVSCLFLFFLAHNLLWHNGPYIGRIKND